TVNTFCPNDNITREEFIKLVVMAFVPESKRVPADVAFDDVDDGEWYADYVKIAYGLNIVKGVGDNRFGTGETITRQDAAVMVYNTAVMLEMMSKAESWNIAFEDEANMADYAKDAIYTMAENGIINGVDGVNFAPCDYLTRAEAAKIIYGVYTIEY
ncbi:MAG: S-layer homology domain-containing protein, partial [Monoglobaceae bacterium]